MPKAVYHALGGVALDLVDVFIPTEDAIYRRWLSVPVVDRALIPGFFGAGPRVIIRTFLLLLNVAITSSRHIHRVKLTLPHLLK